MGDRYPWALCIGWPEVRDYVAGLAAEVAALGGADAIELEACGWFGAEHGSAHDKTGGVTTSAAGWLLSLCFCQACEQEYTAAGADPAALRSGVRSAADTLLAGPGSRPEPGLYPAVLLGPGGADGVVLSCWDTVTAPGVAGATAATAPVGARIAAGLLAVAGLGGRPGTLAGPGSRRDRRRGHRAPPLPRRPRRAR